MKSNKLNEPKEVYENCPVCEMPYQQRGMKRHLVGTHGWRYTEESPNYPNPPTNKRKSKP